MIFFQSSGVIFFVSAFQKRGMATEKQCTFISLNYFVFMCLFLLAVKLRINGTKNIAKITKSMKMVSAAKLRGDQQRLAAADPFAVGQFVCLLL